MTFPLELFILFGVSVLCSSVGLYKYLYFASIGYGLSIAGCGTVLMILFLDEGSWLSTALCGILIVYGCRLAAFLFFREKGNGAYRKHMKKEMSGGPDDMGFKLMLWFSCAALYALMVSPVCYRLVNHTPDDRVMMVGAALMAAGVLLETGADVSKGLQKKKYPGEICRRGPYRFVRCPNYFGEILLWSGVFLCGVTSFRTPGQWIIAGLGYLVILFVMFSGARRLEMRQNRTYGNDPRYQRYVKKVPIIIPLLPLYSVEKWKFLVF